jgi:hypothetical protein
MTERQSSGLVKKGKFVKRLLDIMGDGIARFPGEIWTDGAGEIGPSQDYVQTNLDKLVASGELILESGNYRVPKATRVEPIEQEAELEEPETVTEEELLKGLDELIAKPARVTAPQGKLARNTTFEGFLSGAYLLEVPGWESAADYYCATHGATWSIVDYGKSHGKRLNFK